MAGVLLAALAACVGDEEPQQPIRSANPDHVPTQTEPGLTVSGSATVGVQKQF